jgi:hypothetical protein
MFEQLERKIKNLFIQIKSGKITPKDSGIGKWLNNMKDIDEPTYNTLLAQYKTILEGLKK